MLQKFIRVVRALRGPKTKVAFEWPARCEGWRSLPEDMQQLLALLPFCCRFDGCAYGLRTAAGRPMLKPWSV
eukprot:4709338-Lingulodinium_polyedra.AAC.1